MDMTILSYYIIDDECVDYERQRERDKKNGERSRISWLRGERRSPAFQGDRSDHSPGREREITCDLMKLNTHKKSLIKSTRNKSTRKQNFWLPFTTL